MWTYIFFIIFIIVILAIAFTINSPETVEPEQIDYTIESPWSDYTPVSGIDGQCHIYTFVGEDTSLPIIRPDHIKTCNESDSCFDEVCICKSSSCFTDNQLYVKKMSHICESETCIRQNGSIANNGDIEEIFIQCTEENQEPGLTTLQTCSGQLSYISFNKTESLSLNTENSVCLSISTNENTTSIFSASQCNLSSLESLFLIQRANFISGAMKDNISGSFAKIIHRDTGLLLLPVTNEQGVISLTLTSSGGAYNGYYWVLLDSMEYYTLLDTVIKETQEAIKNKQTTVEYSIGTVYIDYSNENQTVVTLPNAIIYLNLDGTYYIEGNISMPQINYDYLMKSPSQIIYASNPSAVPGISSVKEIWNYSLDKYSLSIVENSVSLSLFQYYPANSIELVNNTNIIEYLQFPQSTVSLDNMKFY